MKRILLATAIAAISVCAHESHVDQAIEPLYPFLLWSEAAIHAPEEIKV